jgi:protein subunit release factor B
MAEGARLHERRIARLLKLGLTLEEFEERFSRSSGPGGQHVNKVSTAVTLRHVPTGRSVTAQDSRSQSYNRQLAWERLLSALEAEVADAKKAKRAALALERRRNSRRPRGVQKRILESKRRRSELKRQRQKP